MADSIDIATLKAEVLSALTDVETVLADALAVANLVNELPDLPGVTTVKKFVADVTPWVENAETVLKDVVTFLDGA
jgi:hypothetical protein